MLVEQVAAVLKRAGVGVPVTELIRKVGISTQTFLPMEEGVRRAGGRSGFKGLDFVATHSAAFIVGASTQTYSSTCVPLFVTLCRVAGGM